MDLPNKYRPTKLSELVAQDDAVETLQQMGRRGAIPHAILLSGPSGTGKTTVGRILRRKLKCADVDYVEVNAAQHRGIEMVRNIEKRVHLAPMGGGSRVWLVDEAHQLTPDAIGGFLKLLEDPPVHAYFILATTDPQKLRKAIRTRCTDIVFKPIPRAELRKLAQNVADSEGIETSDEVLDKIAEVADGSARSAIKLVNQIAGVEDAGEQLDLVRASTGESDLGIELARALMDSRKKWSDIVKILKAMHGEWKNLTDIDPEGIRRLVLAYATSAMLRSPKLAEKAYAVIAAFSDPFYDNYFAGLCAACYEVLHGEQ